MKYQKWHNTVFFAFATLSFLYLAYRFFQFEHWSQLQVKLIHEQWFHVIAVLFLLWLLNLFLESLKWQYLLHPLLQLKLSQAGYMVLIGFAAGSISPMRLGEPAGRIITLRPENRPSGLLAALYGSYLNSAVLLVPGVLFFPLAVSKGLIYAPIVNQWNAWVYVPVAVFCVAGSYIILLSVFKRIKRKARNSRWLIQQAFFQHLSIKNSLVLITLTAARWLIFNLQLFFIFRLFNVPVLWTDFFLLSSVYFAGITFIPGMFFVDLGIRGSLAVFIFGTLAGNAIVAVSAVFILWSMNVALPTFIGAVLMLQLKNKKIGSKQGIAVKSDT